MEEVVDLLNEKNEYLEQFYRLNEAELMNFNEGKFENLETFYASREGLLDKVQNVDRSIDESATDIHEPGVLPGEVKVKVLRALDHKNELVTRILSQDLQILSFIENEKSKIIKELSQVRASRKALGGYKGKPGKGRLDEEA